MEDSTLLAVLARVGFDPEGEDANGLTPSDHAEAAGLVDNVATLASLARPAGRKNDGALDIIRPRGAPTTASPLVRRALLSRSG